MKIHHNAPLLDDNQRFKRILEADSNSLRYIDEILLGNRILEDTSPKGIEDVRTYTQSQAARMLGISYNTIHRMVKTNRIGFIMMNGLPRIPHYILEEYLKSA